LHIPKATSSFNELFSGGMARIKPGFKKFFGSEMTHVLLEPVFGIHRTAAICVPAEFPLNVRHPEDGDADLELCNGVRCDLKSVNIFPDGLCEPRVADFMLSKSVGERRDAPVHGACDPA
jgi:hypothetical protein